MNMRQSMRRKNDREEKENRKGKGDGEQLLQLETQALSHSFIPLSLCCSPEISHKVL